MVEKITRFVLEGEIDDATVQQLREIALEKGLWAAAFIVPSLTEFSDGLTQVPAPMVAENDPHEDIQADRHQLKNYAQTIGFDLRTMGIVWNMMVSEAFENPENNRFQFQSIPTYRTRYLSETNIVKPIPDEATGLNITRLFGWVTEMQAEITEREPHLTKVAFSQFIARSCGSFRRFKLLANFAYSQMGEAVPYDPKTFSMMGRKEKDSAIEQTALRLRESYVVNTEHPLVEQVEIFVGVGRQPEVVPGISLDNMGSIISQHKQDLGINDVNRSLSAAFTNYDSLRGIARTLSNGASAYSIDGLISSLQISSVRAKEILGTLLSEVLIEDPTKKDTLDKTA